VTDRSSLRVADADREQLAAELREHMVAGRLTQEELEERLERAYKASTRAELDAVRDDLPMSPATLDAEIARRRARLRRHVAQEAGAALGLSGVCVAIWAASGASGGFWPIWVFIAVLIPLTRDVWRLVGPAPDHDALEARMLARRARHAARERRRSHRHRELPR
jgi:Domain of unknown function (DUF1707)